MKTAAGQRSSQSQVDAAGFDDGVSIPQIDFQNAIHLGERNHDATTDRQTASGQTCSSSSRYERNLEAVAFQHDANHFFTVNREHNNVRCVLFNDVSITFVDNQFIRSVEQSIRTDNVSQPLQKLRRDDGRCWSRKRRRTGHIDTLTGANKLQVGS
jgi:hypothetical protein